MPKLELAQVGDREVVITRSFNAPRERVWACHTRAELVRRWLLGPPGWTMPICEIDLRPGGRYRYVWRNLDAAEMGMQGVYRELAEPRWLSSTEVFDADWTGGETQVTHEFTAIGSTTLLTTRILYASAEARRAALATRMADGMEMSFGQLDAVAGESGSP